jgi:metallophosphoesterase (TIGR00282 family)
MYHIIKNGVVYMRILCIGDVVGQSACNWLLKNLPKIRRENNVDFTVINGENAAEGNGILPSSADLLFSCGADVITTGNHAFKRREINEYIDEHECLIRPLNFHPLSHGQGYCVVDMGRCQIAVVNLIGRIYMSPCDSPFDAIDKLLKEIPTKNIIVDFHAEATSEKRVMGYYLDGRVSAVVGTHTHVPTADECILPNGTAYVTDIGMVGARDSILGCEIESSSRRIVTGLPSRLSAAQGEIKMDAVIMDLDENLGKVHKIYRLY